MFDRKFSKSNNVRFSHRYVKMKSFNLASIQNNQSPEVRAQSYPLLKISLSPTKCCVIWAGLFQLLFAQRHSIEAFYELR